MVILPVSGRESKVNRDRLLSKDYILLMFSSFTVAMLNHFLLSAMPLYVYFLGGTTLQAGLFITVYALTALAVRPASGMLSDKFGRVRFLVFSAAMCSVFSIFYGYTAFFPLLFVFRSIHGIGFGIHSTCANAAAADVVPRSRLAEGLGYFSLYSTVAQAIGPGIAMTIVAGDTLSDYQALFYLAAALCAAATVTNCFITYERKRRLQTNNIVEGPANAPGDQSAPSGLEPSDEANQSQRKNDQDIPLPRTLLGFEYAVFLPIAVIILVNIGIAAVFGFLAPFARWKGLGNPGFFFAISAIGVLISRMLFGRLVDMRGSDIVIIPGIAVLITCLALLPSVASRTTFFILAFPIGLAQGSLLPTLNAMIFRRCSPARRGTAAGAYFTALDIGYAFGAPLLGALADALDFRYIYWAGAVFSVMALALYLLACSDKRFYARHPGTPFSK